MSLDQLLATNIFSKARGGVQREYVMFNEALTAEVFADGINTGKMSVEDAWQYFWSYEEVGGIFCFTGRNILPAWKPLVATIFHRLDVEEADRLLGIITDDYLQAEESIEKGAWSILQYNPFCDTFQYALRLGATRYDLPTTLYNRINTPHPRSEEEDDYLFLVRMQSREAYKEFAEYALDFGLQFATTDRIDPVPKQLAVNILLEQIVRQGYLSRFHFVSPYEIPRQGEPLTYQPRREHASTRRTFWDAYKHEHRHKEQSTSIRKSTRPSCTGRKHHSAFERVQEHLQYNDTGVPPSSHEPCLCGRVVTVSRLHQALKPKGYNPAVKKLVIPDGA